MRQRARLLVATGALLCALSAPREARSDAAATEFAASLAEEIQSLHAQTETTADRLQRCHELMKRKLELDVMAQAAATDIWKRMNASQQTIFRTAFEARMGTYCVRAIGQYDGRAVLLAGVRRAGDHEQLATLRVGLADGSERMLTWRLRNFAGSARAVDVVGDGLSVVASERRAYATFLQSNDNSIDALLASLGR